MFFTLNRCTLQLNMIRSLSMFLTLNRYTLQLNMLWIASMFLTLNRYTLQLNMLWIASMFRRNHDRDLVPCFLVPCLRVWLTRSIEALALPSTRTKLQLKSSRSSNRLRPRMKR